MTVSVKSLEFYLCLDWGHLIYEASINNLTVFFHNEKINGILCSLKEKRYCFEQLDRQLFEIPQKAQHLFLY